MDAESRRTSPYLPVFWVYDGRNQFKPYNDAFKRNAQGVGLDLRDIQRDNPQEMAAEVQHIRETQPEPYILVISCHGTHDGQKWYFANTRLGAAEFPAEGSSPAAGAEHLLGRR